MKYTGLIVNGSTINPNNLQTNLPWKMRPRDAQCICTPPPKCQAYQTKAGIYNINGLALDTYHFYYLSRKKVLYLASILLVILRPNISIPTRVKYIRSNKMTHTTQPTVDITAICNLQVKYIIIFNIFIFSTKSCVQQRRHQFKYLSLVPN